MISRQAEFEASQRVWLAEQFDSLTDTIEYITPSQWAEENRYLPPAVTPLPGLFSFDVTPFMREILDCLGISSTVRELALMKGAQICATTAILENIIGYLIGHVKTSPVMMVTADADLAQLRMTSYITPMLQESGLIDLIRSADETNKRKRGKALDLQTLIPTPSGLTPIGKLRPGDHVYAPDGSSVSIDCESDVHERPCYEVTFATGEKIVASDDHRWVVHTNFPTRVTLTTEQLWSKGVRRGHGYNFRVPVTQPVAGSDQRLLIKPYTLGAWLGDGSSSGANIAVGAKGMPVLGRIAQDGYETKEWTTTKCPVFGINVPGQYGKGTDNFYSRLRRLDLIRNKHIPPQYLSALEADRMELLRGLMDTDGSCAPDGRCQISQKNRRLAEGIWQLVCSLGIKPTIRQKVARSQHGTACDVSVIEFYAPKDRSPFTLEYKSSRLKETVAPRSYRNAIVAIEPVGTRAVKCIGVDHPDHMFLCGTGHIPTHNTDKKLEWVGGGSLVPFGAQNANKFRSITAQVLLNDEVDGWPEIVGKDGDPVKLIRARAASYESTRKVLDLSTPNIKGQSKIEALFRRGDQRYYNVKCLKCSHPQVLRWARTDPDTGQLTGIVWETNDAVRLVPGSVRYLCEVCSHPHTENDKPRLFAENNAQWVPTAEPVAPDIRSYHLSALYSPVGMQSWESCVRAWLEAWDVERARPRDLGKLQVFYNNILGETFELRGEKLRMENVSAHRRHYKFGEIPNEHAAEFSGSAIQLLTCAVDVHADSLKVAVIGWCRDRRAYLIQYDNYDGDPAQVDDPDTWGRIRSLIETKEWIADDGKRYNVALTLVDSGYLTDQVYRFCAEYQSGVYPVKGRASAPKSTRVPEFSDFTTPNGIIAYGITVDMYKDRWSAALRRSWDGHGLQPNGHFNAPLDVTDKQLKELTVEVKREKIEKSTGKRVGVEWHRPHQAANELWDLIIYSAAGLDLLAWNLSKMADLEFTNWQAFWDVCESGRFFTKQ